MNELIRMIDEVMEDDNLQASPTVWYCLHRLKELLPTQQWIPEWIPVSERLPEISSTRLALRYSNGLVTGGTYLGNKTFDVDFHDCNKKTTVMEWMPLPKPYEGIDNEKNIFNK